MEVKILYEGVYNRKSEPFDFRFEVFTATSDLDAYHLAMDFCKSEVTLLELQQLNEKYEPVRWVDLQSLLLITTSMTLWKLRSLKTE